MPREEWGGVGRGGVGGEGLEGVAGGAEGHLEPISIDVAGHPRTVTEPRPSRREPRPTVSAPRVENPVDRSLTPTVAPRDPTGRTLPCPAHARHSGPASVAPFSSARMRRPR